MILKRIFLLLLIIAVTSGRAQADEIPGDCLASFNVKDQKLSAGVNWILGTGAAASMSCAAGELLREKLFVEGESMLTQKDLTGSPADAQKQAIAAYDAMVQKIQQLPGDNTAGTLFAAGGYLYAKYQLASCILTVEEAGGTCWIPAVKFFTSTSTFFLKAYTGQANSLRKQDLLTTLQPLRPVISSAKPGRSDPAGARSRWIATQTQLCRAIQRQCL